LHAFPFNNPSTITLKSWKNGRLHTKSDMRVYKKQFCNPKQVQTLYCKMGKVKYKKCLMNTEKKHPCPWAQKAMVMG
jgi:hypothetical protein